MSLLTSTLKKVFEKHRGKVLLTENYSGRSVTGAQLLELSGKIAAALIHKGVEKGSFVPIILPRCIDYIAAEIGVLRAGCGYAPVLPEYPQERVDYIKNDCQAPAVIDEAFIRFAMTLDPLTEDVETGEDDVSLLIYTSGSTGNPKGVIHTHRSFYETLDRDQCIFAMNEDDKTLGLVSFSFAWSVAEVYDTLIVGAQLIILNIEERKDLKYVRNAIRENGVTVLYINPNMLKRLDLYDSTLRAVKTAGERLADFYTDEYQIVNIYGTSETNCALSFTLDRAYENTPIGKASLNTRVVLLDENGRGVSQGQEGEICICGYLAKGYLNLPEQTAKVFEKDPFSDDGSRVLYHTGDMGRMLPDGSVLYINRKDWMVKINGQRVETGEIEVRIVTDHSDVETAVVKAFENEYGLTYLAAYYKVNAGASVTAEQIEASLRQRLPDYMIPRFFTQVEAFPLNPNGKIDRKAILPPMAASFKEEYVAPVTENERLLCAAFEKLLKCGQVGVNDNFFSLGGDSLLAMSLQAEPGLSALSSEMIFAGKTPAKIAARLEQAETSEGHDRSALTEYPLSPYETGMYLEHKLDPDSKMYNLIGYYEVRGASSGQIKAAVEEIFRSHEAFHSVYRERDGALLRVLTDEMPSVAVRQIDDISAVRELAEKLDKPYDLSGGIPVSAVIYTDGLSCVLALFYHHIMFDGGSDVLFGKELFARLSGKTPVTDNFDLSGASQTDKEPEYRRGFEKYQEMFADGVPVTELPLKAARPKVHPESDTDRHFVIGGDLLQGLKQAARQRSASLFAMLLSAYSMTAAKYTASEDIVISVPVNTRDGRTRNTIGMFVNTALLRLRPVRTKSTDEYILEVQKAVSDYVNENRCPFDRLVAAFADGRDASRSLLADLGVNYVPLQTSYDEDGITLNTSYRLQPSGKDINLVMQVKDQHIDCYLQYSSVLFEDTVIDNFIDQFITTAEKLCEDQTDTVRQALALPFLQQRALKAYSAVAKAEIPVRLLHKLFEQSVYENAGKTALIAKDKTLSYRELNESANIAAHNLIGRGVGTGDSVVLLLPRESVFFSCLFGVNKAGAAFIPCDPQYPADRIRSIIEDSGAAYIITTKDKLSEYPADKAIDVEELLSGNDTGDPDIAMNGDELAYMIYTSGSTGKPKGVMLAHKGICNYLMPHPANTHIHYLKNHTETYLSVTTVSFDMSFKEHTAALCNGKTLVFASEDEMNDPRALAELMKKYRVDCMNATPSRLQQYMEYEPFRNELAKCRLVMSGGEGYPISLRDAIKACSEDIRIINTYGPTEITVSCNAADLTDAPYVTVGRPLLNYFEYIVDKYGDIAPFGTVGELYVGGAGVAAGYRNLPEKTAEAFVDCFGQRMYRTGDYAKYDRDGSVFILGRLDSQVKLRGLRIELSEIEGLIEAQPHIKKAVVVIRPLGGQDNLCAYFTADREIDIDELRDELKKHLTHYMVPAAFLQMDALPVTANGKTDTKRLPDLTAEAQTIAAPQTELQQRIYDIAVKALGTSDFGVDTELYSAGLTSLNSVGFCIRLSDAFGVNVQIRDLRDNDTVEKLESFIQTLAQQDGEEFEVFDEYAVTKTQEGIFFETLSHPDSPVYNVPGLFKLDESIELPRLRKAVAAAVNAHPYMMTRMFIDQNGGIRQRRTDRTLSESEIEEVRCGSVEELIDDLVVPFDIQKEDLFRFKLITTDSGNYLFYDIHHIVFDGGSKNIFLRDISAAYRGETLEPERYSGYEAALVEEKLRASEHYQASKEYYTRLLDGVENDCLPYNDVLTGEKHKGCNMLNLTGKEDIPSVIKEYCGRYRVSENAFCTSVFGWLLGKYCGRDDSVFTVVNNGRNDPRFNDSISMFVRTYPVHCDLENTDVESYIKEIGRQLADSLRYDVYSFAEISHDLNVSADVLFVYQSTLTDGRIFDFCGAKAESIPLTFEEDKAKIEILIYPTGNRLSYHCSFDADLYTEGFIREMIMTYERALSEFAVKSNTADIRLVDAETQERLEAVNRFEHEYEITDMVTPFRRQAAKTPDNIAVVYLDRTYTYRKVDRMTENIAAFLRSKGIGKNQAVSVMIPRCEYMPIASIGVLKSGAGYQPLDPGYPSERLEFMIRDADAKYLIADRSLMDRLPNYDGPVLYTDEIPDLPDADRIPDDPDPSDLFIMLYTSGSTGVPKGVMLEHHNLRCFCEWYITNYGIDETSRSSAYASYGFDCHMLDMYPVLFCGGQLHIIDESIRLDLIAIKEYFHQHGITHTFMTTQVGRQYADLFPDASYPRHLIVAGEKLVPVDPPSGFTLYNGYGPTESFFTHMFTVDRLYSRVPIGKPLYNMKQYIVDKNLNRLPFGMPGELIVAGHQVARGYLNRPEKNAEVFIRNPFTDEPGYEHAYRTGDIVRIMPDGTADFIGRNDGQVKVRGFRIELSEVESVIRKFPGIRDATVQAFDEAGGGKFIAAYVVADEPVDVDALDAFIRRDKPAYMVPAVTMQIDRIPLNQNQKVNKRALPAPVRNTRSAEKEREARPLTLFEEEIAAVAKRLLGDIEIHPAEPLTSCGLTSISAIGLVATLADKFDVEVSADKLLDGASIIDIENMIFSEWMQRGFAQRSQPQDTGAAESPRADRAPLSPVQLAVYYDAMKSEADVVYNLPMCLQFDHIDAQRLAEAVRSAVSAHSYLNTHIELSDGELIQVCGDEAQVRVETLALNADELERFKNTFIRPFDLHKGPLYRFAVVSCDDKTYLFFDVHHLIFDGLSRGVLLRDISKAYTGEALSPESYTYFDYAQESEAFKESGAYTEAGKYFDKMFERFEAPTEIPADRSGSAENGVIGETSCAISKQAVDTFCRHHNVQPSAFFLAAVFYTTARFAGTKDVYLSTISSGRESVKTRNTIGMFVHTLPLAMSFDDKQSVLELVKASNSVIRGSIGNEDYPFTEIAAKYGYKTGVMYECQLGVITEGGSVGGSAYQSVRLHYEAPKFKVVFSVVERGGEYAVRVIYNDALYSEPYMQTLADSIGNLTERMTADKDADVSTLSLITKEDKRSLIDLGVTAKQEIETRLLHRIFENTAAANLQKTALIACDKTLTYAELNQNANRIAHSLTQKGVCKGDGIVLLLPRRSFYFEAMFGVLKAGAAFVPCDPEYPADRIRHITEDSGSRFIITTREHTSDYPADKVLLIDSLYDNENTKNPDVPLTGQDLAYMIYTSGSTGKPKGVMLRHEGICSYITPHPANIHIHNLKEQIETFLSVTTVSFDMSFKEHTATLCVGKTLVFASEDQMNDPRALTRLMKENKVDCINATPSRLQQYMEYEPFRNELAKCRMVMSGGEAYPISLRNAVKECSEVIMIINTYGPTEITVSSNAAVLNEADHIHIGRPLLNYTEYIVDSDLNLLPRGVIGELLIGGPGVAKGYRNLPEQTEERFIMYNGERVYRSGDYAKWDENGNVIVLGRMDGQIKLRGLRIELSEIEGLMEQQPHIRRAAAAVRNVGGRENLCAWFTADATVDLAELRAALAQKLTHYMVPAAMMQVDAIPVTPNGKTNVKALPDPELTESGEYEAPVNEAEGFFCKLFAEILGLDKVGATDDFFSIGGTSLAVTSVMIKATENGYELTYGDVFKYTTPRQLAAKFTGEGDTKSLSAARFDQYDYSRIHELLSKNTEAAFLNGEKRPIGNILLTGATGFMGIHVLAQFLKTQSGTAYCMLRKGRFPTAVDRVKSMLVYYFDETVEKEFDRVQVFDGDVTNYDSFKALLEMPIDTVFNCAASVKHFSSGTDIEDINVGGVKNCIRFCLEKGARLIHFSTTSVSGAIKNQPGAKSRYLDEHVLYFGQILENQYTSSKLLAERVLFEAAVRNGLDAKVIRVGTLAPRESDGEFQINFLSNSFMGRLRSFVMLKAFPHSMINNPLRMGPIDTSVKAFLLLAQTPADCRLFNAVNTHTVPLIDVIRILNELGLGIKVVENELFDSVLEQAEQDPAKAAILASMLAYKNMNGNNVLPVETKFDYTSKILSRMGFYWNNTDKDYIRRFIEALMGLGFFDENNLSR